MSPEDCRQTLGIADDAGPQAIRQAYLDLARVWHPDRFESDARLRKIAEERFQRISQAYTTLKNCPAASSDSGTRRESPRPSATATEDPPQAAPRASWTPPQPQWTPPQPQWTPPGRPAPVFRRQPRLDSMGRFAMIACLVAAPTLAVMKIVPLLRAPVFDTEMVASHAFRPRILEPMSSINTSADLRSAADSLTVWAHGDAVDLWKPVGAQAAPTARSTLAPAVLSAPTARARPLPPKLRGPPPASGADLLAPARLGAGELGVANHSDLEAVVKLVGRNRIIVRAVYLAPNATTVIHSIAVGVYDLMAEMGHDFDGDRLRFDTGRIVPAELGPFQFAEITSEAGVSGNRYDVVLNPSPQP